MGKFDIGKRVRDDDGDEGVIVAKRQGEREVRYDAPLGFEVWVGKSCLTAIGSTVSGKIIASNDNHATVQFGDGQTAYRVDIPTTTLAA